tara:strand:+ start:40 stop:681 length:642 start_codon:yes stop_codon:yes gene_type:complete
MSLNKDSNQVISNLSEIISNCSNLSKDYERKHGELLEVADGFEKAVLIIKTQINHYKDLITNLFNIINQANILSNNDLNQMRIIQDKTMENFKKLKNTLEHNSENKLDNSIENLMDNYNEIFKNNDDLNTISKDLNKNNDKLEKNNDDLTKKQEQFSLDKNFDNFTNELTKSVNKLHNFIDKNEKFINSNEFKKGGKSRKKINMRKKKSKKKF